MAAARFPELIKAEFGVGREITLLTTTLYLLGIALGPMIFGPVSEVYGRKSGVLIPLFISSIFTFATASTYNVASMMICRFFSGFFAGAPIVSSGGVLADLWNPAERGSALAVYSLFVAGGVAFGPTISSLLMYAENEQSAWRIPQYFSGLVSLTLCLLTAYLSQETYEPIVLARLAKHMRIKSGKWSIHAKHDEWKLTTEEFIHVHLLRPFKMLITPIVAFIVLFASYTYAILYLFITTIADAFNISRGWTGTISTLPNFALFLGICLGCLLQIIGTNDYAKKVAKNDGKAIPEERFSVMIYTAWLIPVGLFMFGWTSDNSIHWIVPCLGIFLFGVGFLTVFQGNLNYLVDVYTKYSASAIAANTFARSVAAASFPLFSKQLFENLGIQWGSSLIGFIALGMVSIPYFFRRYGAKIRSKSTVKLL
ncbi:putative MFS-type transporter [Wickerhamomyces ciferrii]|uniref:MFS-type transporter n=1 Tax=Wickerhamomyces ciferrii (strain ATCC 14091 / BCRC 22168 / CBS 111 / JCM 3599 / NBRC 0793 / NRRL Y-1031 F-60-10) TaxID=1206466 RepID=K0KN45_WICCF|nr:putative MFS-type transporter [Wickerhamomyces ciferrii]CCH42553.1 putative MFS-type transporter [Wickerhamomyces ciferrii]